MRSARAYGTKAIRLAGASRSSGAGIYRNGRAPADRTAMQELESYSNTASVFS